jgi:hypothetical protein
MYSADGGGSADGGAGRAAEGAAAANHGSDSW